MIPETGLDPVPDRLGAGKFQEAFLRGRILIMIVAVGTAITLLKDDAYALWLEGVRDVTPEQVLGWFFCLLICWRIYRGGKLSHGFASLMYGLGFVYFWGVSAYLVLNTLFSALPPHGLQSWKDAMALLALGGWATFALWALLLSGDVRLYRRARYLAMTKEDAAFFRWPPPRRNRGGAS